MQKLDQSDNHGVAGGPQAPAGNQQVASQNGGQIDSGVAQPPNGSSKSIIIFYDSLEKYYNFSFFYRLIRRSAPQQFWRPGTNECSISSDHAAGSRQQTALGSGGPPNLRLLLQDEMEVLRLYFQEAPRPRGACRGAACTGS